MLSFSAMGLMARAMSQANSSLSSPHGPRMKNGCFMLCGVGFEIVLVVI